MPVLAFLLLLAGQPDSSRLAARARDAQAEFERARMFLLRTGSAGDSHCDARIGRFCYSYSGGADGRLPPEPAGIGRARAKLLVVLDSVARAIPGDAWVAGQRVRYWLEAGQPDSAVAAARWCRASAWWCAALQGLARHETGDFEAAERAFDTALDSMPETERCRWTDLSDLLEKALRDRYRRLSCAERRGFEERVWWLARPLWSLRGNDRRTEHFARLTMARLLEDARWALGDWGEDARELIVRYGWPLAWERDDCGGWCRPIPLGYLQEPSFHFLPEPEAFDAGLPDDAKQGVNAEWARERYAPAYAARFEDLTPDFAAFLRGDSTLVVAGWEVSSDTALQDSGLVAALVLARDERSPEVVTRRRAAHGAGALIAEAAWAPSLASLELVAPDHRAAGRIRARLAPLAPSRGAVTLSGILLFDPADSLPADLPAALARLHVGGVPAGERVGIYWEAYGLASGEDVPTAVTVAPGHRGLLTRVAAALGLAPKSGSIRLEWHETAHPPQGTLARALVLDLAALKPGRYRVDVTVSPPGRGRVTSSRTVSVVRQ
jgi:hypothetical protein